MNPPAARTSVVIYYFIPQKKLLFLIILFLTILLYGDHQVGLGGRGFTRSRSTLALSTQSAGGLTRLGKQCWRVRRQTATLPSCGRRQMGSGWRRGGRRRTRRVRWRSPGLRRSFQVLLGKKCCQTLQSKLNIIIKHYPAGIYSLTRGRSEGHQRPLSSRQLATHWHVC